ncbi:MAG TPA: hypothetical protein VK138_08815 [Acidiferrobacterales bacterium]|nr:hypothetical protein [Acidiferrobacterales bacterium]
MNSLRVWVGSFLLVLLIGSVVVVSGKEESKLTNQGIYVYQLDGTFFVVASAACGEEESKLTNQKIYLYQPDGTFFP